MQNKFLICEFRRGGHFDPHLVPWCSRLSRLTLNQKVMSSSLIGTKPFGVLAQLVERLLCMQKVWGSIP